MFFLSVPVWNQVERKTCTRRIFFPLSEKAFFFFYQEENNFPQFTRGKHIFLFTFLFFHRWNKRRIKMICLQ